MSVHPIRIRLTATALALALAPLTACHLNISNDAEARDEWRRTYPLAEGGTLEVANTNGTIEIEAIDGNQIEVVAERIVRASTDEIAKEQLASLEIRETVSETHVKLDSAFSGINLMNRASRQVRYRIKAPRSASVRVGTTNGEVTVRGITGAFRAESTNGTISAEGLVAGAQAETTNGRISLVFDRVSEDVTCETTNGAITVTVPPDANARVSARVTNGGISADGVNMTVTDSSRRRLDGTLGSGGPTIRLETTNGGITLRQRNQP